MSDYWIESVENVEIYPQESFLKICFIKVTVNQYPYLPRGYKCVTHITMRKKGMVMGYRFGTININILQNVCST